jgi:hypothetical protein
MLSSTTACCVAVLNQQQQSNIHRHRSANQLTDDVSVSVNPNQRKYCTVVENGRVVVKPIAPVDEQLDASAEAPSCNTSDT